MSKLVRVMAIVAAGCAVTACRELLVGDWTGMDEARRARNEERWRQHAIQEIAKDPDMAEFAKTNPAMDQIIAKEREVWDKRLNDANSVQDFIFLLKRRASDDWEATVLDRSREWHCSRLGPDDKPMPTTRQEDIRNGRVCIGMDWVDCLAAWGLPIETNRTRHEYATHEQWVYREYRGVYPYRYAEVRYLYFEDGRLTTIQD